MVKTGVVFEGSEGAGPKGLCKVVQTFKGAFRMGLSVPKGVRRVPGELRW